MILGALVLALALLPLAMIVVNVWLYRVPPRAEGTPGVSVLVPARDEERNIGETVRRILANTGVALELIVLDDHSTDGTAAILAGFTDPRLRVVAGPPLPPGWVGKQHACARLAEHASHELMVFLDADVRLEPEALSRIAGALQAPGAALASGFPRQITRTWAERLLLHLMFFLLLGFLPLWAMRRSRSVGLGAGCGQLIAVRRAAYEAVGGHTAIRASRHDGLHLPRAFRRAGFGTALFDASRFAACRMYVDAGEVWRGLLKNATEGMATRTALPVWTVLLGAGQVLPLALVLIAPNPWAFAALACGYLSRLVLVWRCRASVPDALLHPLGVAALLALQWVALWRAAAGRPATWRGRVLPAG